MPAYVGWRLAWRGHVAKMRTNPTMAMGYGYAAVIAQAMYVMGEALYLGKLKRDAR